MARKLSTDAINIIYAVLKASPLFNAVGGKFFKGNKVTDFLDECVVITCLPMTKDQLQVCVVMANIYVPNIEVDLGNKKKDRSQANYPRLAQLALMLDTAVSDYDKDDYSIRIESEYVMDNEGFNEHYSNNRLIFRNENI